MAFDISWGGSFLAGLLSFLSPCVLPLVPPYMCFLAGSSLDELAARAPDSGIAARATARAAAFVLGFSAVFVALGASATMLGGFLAQHLTALSWVAGAVIVLFGLHFLGVLKVPLLYREARFRIEQTPAGLAGAFLIGLAFAFGWTPCVGPVLASILFFAGSEDTASRGALLLAFYAMGIGVPFLLAGIFIRPFLGFMSRFRRHLGLIEKALGAMLVLTGLFIVTGFMPVIGAWLLETFPVLGRVG